jgi:hypothetical protein
MNTDKKHRLYNVASKIQSNSIDMVAIIMDLKRVSAAIEEQNPKLYSELEKKIDVLLKTSFKNMDFLREFSVFDLICEPAKCTDDESEEEESEEELLQQLEENGITNRSKRNLEKMWKACGFEETLLLKTLAKFRATATKRIKPAMASGAKL